MLLQVLYVPEGRLPTPLSKKGKKEADRVIPIRAHLPKLSSDCTTRSSFGPYPPPCPPSPPVRTFRASSDMASGGFRAMAAIAADAAAAPRVPIVRVAPLPLPPSIVASCNGRPGGHAWSGWMEGGGASSAFPSAAAAAKAAVGAAAAAAASAASSASMGQAAAFCCLLSSHLTFSILRASSLLCFLCRSS